VRSHAGKRGPPARVLNRYYFKKSTPRREAKRKSAHSPIMTPLKPTHPFTQTLCLLVAIGCSSHINLATETGGAGNGLPTGGWGPITGGASSAGTPSGGSIGTGGSACCNLLPTCDVADYVVSSANATACLPGGGLSTTQALPRGNASLASNTCVTHRRGTSTTLTSIGHWVATALPRRTNPIVALTRAGCAFT
jgi:hypothetical protein